MFCGAGLKLLFSVHFFSFTLVLYQTADCLEATALKLGKQTKFVVMVSEKDFQTLESFNNLEYNTCSVATFSLLAGLYLISMQLKMTDLSNFYQCNCLSTFCFDTYSLI